MPRDLLDDQLREWGNAQLGRHAANDDRERRQELDPGSHPISKARQFAPMTRERFANQVAGRDGRDRRRAMAAGSGVRGMHIVPTWAVDAIRCTETRHAGPRQASVDNGIPAHLRWIDQAAMDLYRQNTLRGLCLRMEYTGFGYQSDKALQVAQAIGAPLTVRQYREELKLAREWLKGRIAA
jgi:hypothetical protein